MEKVETFTAAELMKDYVPLPRPENSPSLTLLQIISIEPRIALVLIALKPSRSNQKWYKQYFNAKSELCKLVGWQAEKFDLRTSQAYDVVMDTVIKNWMAKKGGRARWRPISINLSPAYMNPQ